MNSKESERGWCLKGELKDSTPWIVPLDKLIFTIGRQDTNDLILPSHSVSRRHARIFQEKNDLYIEDLDSMNGVRINGSQIGGKTRIRHGDILKIGDSEFTLSHQDELHRDYEEETLARKTDRTRISFADAYDLSERESEILFFLIKGHSLKQIGESLFISTGTVKNHVLKIYKKTGCHSRIELSTRASGFAK